LGGFDCWRIGHLASPLPQQGYLVPRWYYCLRRFKLFMTMKHLSLSLLFFLSIKMCEARLRKVPLSPSDKAKGTVVHFRRTGNVNADRAVDQNRQHLYLYKNGNFRFEDSGCIQHVYSTGNWTTQNDIFYLRSTLQEDNLPVSFRYRDRRRADSFIHKIAPIVNRAGNVVELVTLDVNNDTTSCIDGDALCTGKFKQVDSFKVNFDRISSKWIPVKVPAEEILEITVETGLDLNCYTVYNRSFRIKNNELIFLSM
jgi:hypothetical protein